MNQISPKVSVDFDSAVHSSGQAGASFTGWGVHKDRSGVTLGATFASS